MHNPPMNGEFLPNKENEKVDPFDISEEIVTSTRSVLTKPKRSFMGRPVSLSRSGSIPPNVPREDRAINCRTVDPSTDNAEVADATPTTIPPVK